MITTRQQELVKQSWQEAHANGWQLVTFWQDHFYTRNGKFGYPVCIQVQNVDEKHIETARILHWSSSPAVCESLVERVDAFIAELDGAVKVPDGEAS